VDSASVQSAATDAQAAPMQPLTLHGSDCGETLSAPPTACPVTNSVQSGCFPSFSPERHVSGPSRVPSDTCDPAATPHPDSSDCSNKSESGCVSTSDSSTVAALESLDIRPSLVKNNATSISDDTLLGKRGHVTFQEPSPHSPQQHAHAVLQGCMQSEAQPMSEFCEDEDEQSAVSSLSRSNATQTSFMTQRTRHSSVPQPASWSRTGVRPTEPGGGQSPTYNNKNNNFHLSRDYNSYTKTQQDIVSGHKISLKLDKKLIDKACKNKGIDPNFGVTLYLIRPDDQSDLNVHHYSQQPSKPVTHPAVSSQSSSDSGTTTGSAGSMNSSGNLVSRSHQPLKPSASEAYVPGSQRSQRLYPPVTREQTSSSPESSSEEESCCGGEHGSSTEGQLACVTDIKASKKPNNKRTDEFIGQTVSINIHDYRHRHRHHTKNAVPTSSSPLAKTEVKVGQRKSAAHRPSAVHAVQNAQSMARRSNSNVEVRATPRSLPAASIAAKNSLHSPPPSRAGPTTTAASVQWT